MKKILFVSSEVQPLIKTGGLADVAGSLPIALAELEQDVRIIIPKYQALKLDGEVKYRCSLRINNYDINILETRLPGTDVIVWLVDCPEFFDVPGNPYTDEFGSAWANSAARFSLFCRVAVETSQNRAHLDWKADIVHCNDWQSGLVPALLTLESHRPSTVFTIHNMAYQGLFSETDYFDLNLPGQLWNPGALEFHSLLSFIKGGIACADHITTVSPNYALEIQTAEYGYGLEGLLHHRHHELNGIINGIDIDVWNPETDTRIAQNYGIDSLAKKAGNKAALQQHFSLPVEPAIPMIGLIGRLVDQKGIDLVIDCLDSLTNYPIQFVLLGSGEKGFEHRLKNLSYLYPDKVAVSIGYNEDLAHLIEAGADMFLMPSRFEPCGLNQLYSQRYGTLPIVRKTGGLADTVVDALPHNIADKTASGFVFEEASVGAMLETIKRAILLYANKRTWQQLQKNAMRKDFSWRQSAQQYLDLYNTL
ncbi:starch synthase [Bathymodiolus platifrons methanotrophic gill symbiont]|uniref:glycogen synthase GlgA n=1 Tax=Bathymodiolus platifrons methanotrophic gill symbiont TaxID=113268 RepID=UPI000B41F385|nr:glycogen synthase GlgA [Bathymodiolus platifrons methanotrophic gill symbiont]MCK5870136.1 glycogen synthase GlgA [Methyloprofundus sp.]TXK99220.1 starch synthase [Methylococcaceae bacterium CS4]TXL00188.1 starch synthase [Methylococcaceae bacterium CS5]TXL01237.1 starch synthase [Methylococcaceae bacterium HT1]TXL08436.1 starch synthase [Methylococcaceae bacterium CS1]TXL09410.1 starch synthase [Methylococcaceae bacterium CS3]TXL11969.1 starch synthase [Methylococcaceae bacterium CS2]TX